MQSTQNPVTTTLGWLATSVLALLASVWGYWGAIETFHEGWWRRQLLANVAEMLFRYLAPMGVLVAVGAVAVLRPRLGAALLWLAAVVAAVRFAGAATPVMLALTAGPVLLGLAFWRSAPPDTRIGLALVVALPLTVAVASGAGPALRVSRRLPLEDTRERRIPGGELSLVWAPAGPGWPEDGVSWHEAARRARHLSEDGMRLEPLPVDHWRLPTVDEVVGTLGRHGESCGGIWDPTGRSASFPLCTPDKEGPLWNRFSKVVYWWTASGPDSSSAFRVAYNGHVLAVPRSVSWGYLGFRAVRARR